MIYVDTGYLVALVNARDELYSRAFAWSQSVDESLLVSEFVLLETVDALSRPDFRPLAHQLITQIHASNQFVVLPLDSKILHAGLDFHRARMDKHWSLTDCISFTLMKDHGITRALAYDLHFEQAGFEPLLRREP